MISNDSLMITLLIEAMEWRETATANFPGAYLYASMDDFIILKLNRQSIGILWKINDKYKQYVIKNMEHQYYTSKSWVNPAWSDWLGSMQARKHR